jgi:putative Holliday junction resolvase
MTRNKKILAIDFGSKYIGLAVGFPSSGLILPKGHIQNNLHAIAAIKEVIQQNDIAEVVLGRPLYPSGESSPQEKQTLDFYHLLKKEMTIPITLVDELLTTKIALQTMKSFDFSAKKRKELKDEFAAQLILEYYFKTIPNKQ